MIDRELQARREDEEAPEREPELAQDTLKDLTAEEEQSDEVRGGVAPRAPQCYCGSM
jgi:hypothetical protein